MTYREVPLGKLILSSRNMRRGEVFIDDLVANIAATGKVLQNLRVTAESDDAGASTGRFEVHVGGRRWRALDALARRKAIKRTFPVPCIVCETESEALEESLAENALRLPPHPADQFAAFHELSEGGKSISEIAERFAISPRVVERRLKLATVSPRLMDLFRADELTLDHMAAFTLTEDHAAQEAAYFDFPARSRQPLEIKRRIVGGAVSSESPLARFVGLDAYRAAGGVVTQDLFAQAEDAGFITDVALVERLATEKLATEAEVIQAEGWAWVEVALSWDYATSRQYGRAYPVPAPLSAEARAEIASLTIEYQTLAAEYGEDDEVAAARLAEIDDRVTILEVSGGETWSDEVKAITGAIVTVGPDGSLRIERGCARPGAEAKALRRLTRGDDAGSQAIADPNTARGTKAVGALPDKLVLDLSAHRTAALRASLLIRPDVALVVIVHALLVQAHYGCVAYDRPHTLEQEADTVTNHPQRHCEGFAESKAAEALNAARGRIALLLPASSHELWPFLMTLGQDRLLELLAYAAAQLVNALQFPNDKPDCARLQAAGQLAQALDLDMAEWWTATAESFFGRVSKATALAAVADGAGAQAAENLAGLKKAALAEAAAKKLQGTAWLPAMLRAPTALPGPAASDELAPEREELPGDRRDDADREHRLAAE